MKTQSERLKLITAIRDSKGERIAMELRGLQSIAWTFAGNFGELKELLTVTDHPRVAFTLWSVDQRALFDEYYDEVLRLLHNFLASVKSLVDHTRVYVDRAYAGHPFREEYQARVDRDFATCSEARFVQELREYVLHYAILPTTARLSGGQQQGPAIKSAILLDVEELRRWSGWKAAAASYLQTLPISADLLEVVSRYEERVRQFYGWFSERLAVIHEPELAERRRLLDELDTDSSPPGT